MPSHRWSEKLKALWKRPIVRALAAVAIAVSVGLVQFRLARIPLPIEVSDAGKIKLPPIRSDEKLIVSDLVTQPGAGALFAYRGDLKEVVDIHFERASIEPDTSSNYRLNQGFETPDRLTYTTRPPGRSLRICTTDVDVVPAANHAPTRLILFQSGGPGNEVYRNLAVQIDREVLVNISTNPPATSGTNADEDGPGCTKLLAGTNLKHLLEGSTLMKSRLTPNARLDLRFLPLNPGAPAWSGGYSGLFEPFRFTSPIFQAKTISISAANGNPVFEATSSSVDQPLRVNKLMLGSDVLQTEISGVGFVKLRGEPITLNFFERIKENPLFTALFVAINAALTAWLLSQIRGLFGGQKVQSTKTKGRKR